MLGLIYRLLENSRSENGSYEPDCNQDREQENSSGLRCRHLAFVEENVHRLDLPFISFYSVQLSGASGSSGISLRRNVV